MSRPSRFLSALLCVGLAAAVALPLAAQPGRVESRVNTYQTGAEKRPRIASGGPGGFVLVWEAPGDPGTRVFCRTANAVGGLYDSEFAVTNFVGLTEPDVAGLTGGQFVVVWTQQPVSGDTLIFGQRYSSNGDPLGDVFAASNVGGPVFSPAVASRSDNGSFVVAYEGVPTSDSHHHVFARRFNSNGSPVGLEINVDDGLLGENTQPAIMAWSGGFDVAWTNEYPSQNISKDIYARRFNVSGVQVGFDLHVNNTYTTGSQDSPAIAGKGDGSFVVTWRTNGQDGDLDSIRARRYAPTGVPSTAFGVNTFTTGHQSGPRVAVDDDGGFMIVWQSVGQDGDSTGVYAQRYDEGGHLFGGEFRVNAATTGTQYAPAVAGRGSATYSFVWTAPDADGTGIFFRSYCLRGDVNSDGVIDVADVFTFINDLFAGGGAPSCADCNGDGFTDVADVFYLINYLFASGPGPV
jgi:hypothetical protein